MKKLPTRKILPALLPVLLLMAAAPFTPLQARLGESPPRMEARYGLPVKIENGEGTRDFQCTYKHDGIEIVVHFLDEKSQYESYSNANGESMDDDAIRHLLEINQSGGKWKLSEDTGSAKTWVLDSREATATYQYKTGHLLEIRTRWWADYVTKRPIQTTNEAGKQLKDF